MEQQTVKTHRVGTITFGILLILFGALFLVHLFIPTLEYAFIFRIWPCIFIFLGLEVLMGNYKEMKWNKEGEEATIKFIYDKTAIFLIIVLSLFSMVMAAIDQCIRYSELYFHY